MTAPDADDAGLVEALCDVLISFREAQEYGTCELVERLRVKYDEVKASLVVHLSAQRREIEELRREVANAREYKKAFQQATLENTRDINEHHETEIAEALKVIAPFAKIDPRWIPSEAFAAASAFAAKHGGRDG